MENEALDFVDIITNVDTYAEFASMGAEKGIDVICQKPIAPALGSAQQMVNKCKQENVRFFLHENLLTPVFKVLAAIRAFQPESIIKENSNNKSLNTLLLENKAGERFMFITEDQEVIKAGGLIS